MRRSGDISEKDHEKKNVTREKKYEWQSNSEDDEKETANNDREWYRL